MSNQATNIMHPVDTTTVHLAEYNNRCAEFLGYKNTTPDDKDFNIYQSEKGMILDTNIIYPILETMSMRFHSDFNWIMYMVEAIEKAGSFTIMGIDIKSEFKISTYGISFFFQPNNQRLLHLELKPYVVDDAWKHPMFENHIIEKFDFKNKSKMEAIVKAIDLFLIWYFSKKNNRNKMDTTIESPTLK